MPTTLTSSQVAAVVANQTTLLTPPEGKMAAAVVSFNFNGGTLTVGQIVQMVALPEGARVVELQVQAEFTGNTEGDYTVGDGGSAARYISSTSLTASSVRAIINVPGGAGYRYTVSSTTTVGYDTIDVTIGGAASQCTTGSIQMIVYYTYDRP